MSSPVDVTCSRCGNRWRSRAADRVSIHCPECGKSVRVPRRPATSSRKRTGSPWRRRLLTGVLIAAVAIVSAVLGNE